MPSSPPCSHSTIEDRSNRIAADIETNEAFPDRKTNPAVFDKLKDVIQNGREYARRNQRAAKKIRPAHCTKKNPSRVS